MEERLAREQQEAEEARLFAEQQEREALEAEEALRLARE
jgi:hypothetical protein